MVSKRSSSKKEVSCCSVKRKMFYGLIGIIIILLLGFTIPKYFTSASSNYNIASDIEKIEIIHFHGTQQCSSCITVGNYAEETMNTYFKQELESGKITFSHVNFDLPENYALASKYEVKGSSLWIGTYHKDGSFTKEENINVWYKTKDKQDYMSYLKSLIESKLSGN